MRGDSTASAISHSSESNQVGSRARERKSIGEILNPKHEIRNKQEYQKSNVPNALVSLIANESYSLCIEQFSASVLSPTDASSSPLGLPEWLAA
jgi:hypothetical protein